MIPLAPPDNGNFIAYHRDALVERITHLEAILRGTRDLVVQGATVGFNPLDGDWAERLFKNQATITNAIGR